MNRVIYRSRLSEIARAIPLALDTAAETIAGMVADEAKGRVPIATGDLRDAIHTERIGQAEYAVVAGGRDAFYGHLVESGTGHSPPQPFLVPATLETEPAAITLVSAELRAI